MKRLAILLLSVAALGAEKPLPEVSKLKLLTQYQKAAIYQQARDAAQAAVQSNQVALDKAIADYHALEIQEAKANGYAEGTSFSVDVAAQTVTPVAPPKKEEPKKQ
jgi:hypothetical protein